MNEDELQAVLDQEALVDRIDRGAMPDWVESHWRTFSEGLTGTRNGTPFPCFFGAESVRQGDPPYTVVPSTTDTDALLGLREYLDVWGRPQRAGVARRLLQAAGRTAVRIGVPRDAVARPAVPPRPRPRAVARQPPGRTRRPVLGVLLRRRADVPRVAPPSTTTARAGTVPSGWRSRSSRARCSSRSASPPTPRPDSALAT